MRRLCSALAAAVLASGCGGRPPEISLSDPAPELKEQRPRRGLRIAISAMESPELSFARYTELFNHIGGVIGEPVELLHRPTYSEVLALVQHRRVDAALVCSGPYVQARADYGAESLAVPRLSGSTSYRALIIVRRDSPFKSLADLKGRSFALTDPLSSSGMMFPAFLLRRQGSTTETFFGKLIFTKGHDNSMTAVADGLVDGASVSGLVYDEVARARPQLVKKLRVVGKSPPFGNPPVIVHPETDPSLKRRLRMALLHLHETEEGRRILKAMRIDAFVPGDPKAYEEVEHMRTVVLAKPRR
ncbi:MAG: phosphate/phosphite/phosphonate ABC transporter substrate-binding protein [Elusimicrobia bacterium]|nr:phosphate/phosphite/phosphonate ABC transporter substrate-binding protein [Elusimicrobiota bacterium]